MAQLKLSEAMSINMALTAVKLERVRQIEEEGFDAFHDNSHNLGELAQAAACYSIGSLIGGPRYLEDNARQAFIGQEWPWGNKWWKPGEPRHMLVKAAALLIAEIERIDRLKKD